MPVWLTTTGRSTMSRTSRAICGEAPKHYPRPWAFFRGERLLRAHTETLLGPSPTKARDTRIMATLPTDAATDPRDRAAQSLEEAAFAGGL